MNQYEFMHIIYGSPFFDLHNGPILEEGVLNAVNSWGITFSWPKGMPGDFPVHDEEHLVLKDVTEWKNMSMRQVWTTRTRMGTLYQRGRIG